MARILGIGLATLDEVSVVDGYPEENAKVRSLERRRARGGNAATTMVVLSQLGHRCALAALLGDDDNGRFILEDLRRHGVSTSGCRMLPGRPSLCSTVLLNRRNGSRTIIHHHLLPALGLADFERLVLAGLDWVHLEGRNLEETSSMLDRLPAPRSVELERARPGWEVLVARAELVIASRDFAAELGQASPTALLVELQRLAPAARLCCPWGAEGAYAKEPGQPAFHSPACPPPQVVDTLGAGDTFNAGLIDGLLRGDALPGAVARANRVAGLKCGQVGVDGLGQAAGR